VRSQLRAVIVLELRRSFLGKQGVPVVLIALVPVALFAAVQLILREPLLLGRIERDFASIFQYMVLQMTLFFACGWTFGNLVRGEILSKSLHHLFLCPIRRDVLVVGKYLAALAGTSVLFGVATVLSYFVLLWGQGKGRIVEILAGGGAAHLASYVLVSFLACVGYGAVFLLVGLFAKSPVVPAVILWGWEHLNFLMPVVLKRLGLIHYLVSLCPVSVPDGPMAVMAEPVPWWAAATAPVLIAAALVAAACWKARRMEIDYGVE
jgi:ABC-type Na+ efflux pump permease subunit